MTNKQLEEVLDIALRLAGEVEWCRLEGYEDHGAFTTFAQMPSTIHAARLLLAYMVSQVSVTPSLLVKVGHQEPELEAAGLVQSAIKILIIEANRRGGGLKGMIEPKPMMMKLASFPVPVRQAPHGAWVPSLAQQAAGVPVVFPADAAGGRPN